MFFLRILFWLCFIKAEGNSGKIDPRAAQEPSQTGSFTVLCPRSSLRWIDDDKLIAALLFLLPVDPFDPCFSNVG
jgi:hypothetical protein